MVGSERATRNDVPRSVEMVTRKSPRAEPSCMKGIRRTSRSTRAACEVFMLSVDYPFREAQPQICFPKRHSAWE